MESALTNPDLSNFRAQYSTVGMSEASKEAKTGGFAVHTAAGALGAGADSERRGRRGGPSPSRRKHSDDQRTRILRRTANTTAEKPTHPRINELGSGTEPWTPIKNGEPGEAVHVPPAEKKA